MENVCHCNQAEVRLCIRPFDNADLERCAYFFCQIFWYFTHGDGRCCFDSLMFSVTRNESDLWICTTKPAPFLIHYHRRASGPGSRLGGLIPRRSAEKNWPKERQAFFCIYNIKLAFGLVCFRWSMQHQHQKSVGFPASWRGWRWGSMGGFGPVEEWRGRGWLLGVKRRRRNTEK